MSAAGTDAWWEDVRGRTLQVFNRGVILDGIGFSLAVPSPLPGVMTLQPGQAPAAWLQKDRNSFTGYPQRIARGG
jgi:hypothetical protein